MAPGGQGTAFLVIFLQPAIFILLQSGAREIK
jgi:hypothetical protein